MLLKRLFAIFVIFIVSANNLWADDTDRIDGVADFLIERANDNYLYILEKRIRDNKALKLYLPTTYDQLTNLDLKRVLQSSPLVWKKSVENDLNLLKERYRNILNQEVNAYVSNKESKYMDIFIEKAKDARLILDGEEYSLTVVSLTAPQKVKEITNRIATLYIDIESALRNISDSANEITFKELKAINKENVEKALDNIYEWETYLHSPDIKIRGVEELLGITNKFKVFLIATRDISQHVENMTNPNLPMTMKVNSALYVIQYFTEKHKSKLFKNPDDYEWHAKFFSQFKQYALFFAQISDAEDSKEVKSILKAYTLPAVSFGVKRNPLEGHFLISSYLGFAAGAESSERRIGDSKSYFGLMAPIGIELSTGMKSRGSISLFASFIDLGPAVNAHLYETESTVKLEDIIAPGFFLVYGIKDYPLAFGLGYQNSRAVRDENSSEHHIMFFAAFDMPLLILY